MGGEKMRAAGCELLENASEVAVVGLAEVVTHLPAIRRRFKSMVAEVKNRRPQAAVLIDFPDFNLRLARELHKLNIPVFYFVSPQIWACRTGRVRQRKKEVRLNLPEIVESARMLAGQSAGYEFVLPVASTLDKDWLREQLAASPMQAQIHLTSNSRATLLHAHAAVVASGTATVEAALAG